MLSGEAIKVVQVGDTFPGVDIFHAALARPDVPFELEAIATVNPDLRGKRLKDTGFKGPSELDDVPFIGVVDAIDNTDAPVVFSNLEDKLVGRYESRLAAGRLVIAGSPARREGSDVPVVGAFVNPGHIDELYARGGMEGRVIDIGSSAAALLSVAMTPLHSEIGIESIDITTMQGWSDTGMYRVPELLDDQRTGVRDIQDGERHKEVAADLNRLSGASISRPANIDVNRTRLQHGPWLRGHYVKVVARLSETVSKEKLESMWRELEVPDELRGLRAQLRALSKTDGDKWPGKYGPIKPVKLEYGELVRSDTRVPRLDRLQPMRVHAHVVEAGLEADPLRLVFDVSGDNLVQGGFAGTGLLNALYARAQGYLD